MATGETPRSALHRFAAERVGIDPDGNSAETIARICRKLVVDDFLPDPLTHEAFLSLVGRPMGTDRLLYQEAARSQERRLLDAIEAFAEEFFAIPVAPRVERWKGLVDACPRRHRLLDRLLALKPGLMVEVPSRKDPSPAVQILVEDLLALFPMRRSTRIAESRARARRFWNDPTLTDQDRSRALKRLRRKHAEIASLSEAHLSHLVSPRRPLKRDGIAVRAYQYLASKINKSNYDMKIIGFFTIMVFIGIFVAISNESKRSTRTLRRSRNIPTVPKPIDPSAPSPAPGLAFPQTLIRNEFKSRIQNELRRIGRRMNEDQLEYIVNSLPVDDFPRTDDFTLLRVDGIWPWTIHAPFVAQLKQVWKLTDLALSEEELDTLASRCFPKPSIDVSPTLVPEP
jgi:hypothetical protein